MELGLSSYTFPWAISSGEMDLFQLVERTKRWQLNRLQICDNLPLDSVDHGDLKKLKRVLQNDNIKLELGTRRLQVDHVLHYLNLAKDLEADFLRLVIDDDNYEPSLEEIVESINTLIPRIQSIGVPLGIENHDRLPSRLLAEIIQETDPEWIRICLDTANSLGAGEGINEVLYHLAHHCINLHIKDVRIKRLEHKMGFKVLGCPAGVGDLNLPEIISRVNHNQLRSITLEVWSDQSGSVSESIAQEYQWAEDSIEYLKKLLKHIN